MRAEIAASILSCDFGVMREQVRQMTAAGCERIHLDVMDGQFVPPITFGAKMAEDLRLDTPFLEAHLMTLTPERHFEAFVQAGCKGVIFHQEATAHAHRLLESLKSMGVRPGIAINPATPVSLVMELAELADLILVMTVNPGWGGQAFIASCLDKVRAIRERHSHIDIEVDGGIDPRTMPQARAAGANVFVVGSYLVRDGDIRGAVEALRQSCASK